MQTFTTNQMAPPTKQTALETMAIFAALMTLFSAPGIPTMQAQDTVELGHGALIQHDDRNDGSNAFSDADCYIISNRSRQIRKPFQREHPDVLNQRIMPR